MQVFIIHENNWKDIIGEFHLWAGIFFCWLLLEKGSFFMRRNKSWKQKNSLIVAQSNGIAQPKHVQESKRLLYNFKLSIISFSFKFLAGTKVNFVIYFSAVIKLLKTQLFRKRLISHHICTESRQNDNLKNRHLKNDNWWLVKLDVLLYVGFECFFRLYFTVRWRYSLAFHFFFTEGMGHTCLT